MFHQNDANPQRLRAKELECEALHALGIHGILTTTQLARWCKNDTHSSYVVIQRVIKRLEERGLIMSRTDRCGRHCFFLTKPGATLLRNLRPEAHWHHGHDLGIINPWRQKQVFELALQEKRAGREVLARPGMRAYHIENTSHADLMVCTETENLWLQVPINCYPLFPLT